MTDFLPGRDQDASPTILGFRYQIQTTVLRWLDLPTHETLLLECGEDIDRVFIAERTDTVQRELEQIKVRSSSVTLRSTSVLSALANFAGHLKANPGLRLRFRFTTTAMPGREKQSPLAKGTKGIEAWQQLQANTQLSENDDQRILAGLLQFLRHGTQPNECPDESWQSLMDIVSGTGTLTFFQFVQSVEWSCGAASPRDLDAVLLDRLGQFPGDTGPGDPARQQRYDQLMAGVLEILSQKGSKQLTKERLEEFLARPTLADDDRRRLRLLEVHSASHDARLRALTARVQQIGLGISFPLLFGWAAESIHIPEFSPALSTLPPLVIKLAHRRQTIDSIVPQLGSPCWLNLYGDYGTGKSHLSFLLAERAGGIAIGVSMRGLSESSAAAGLNALLTAPEMAAALRSQPSGVVLIDDLPNCEPQSQFAMLLTAFVHVMLSFGRVVLSTSRRVLPLAATDPIGSRFIAIPTPPFSDSDANELFVAHEVNETLLKPARVTSLNTVCGGHPMLLAALARHLVARGDEPTQAFLDVLRNKHRAEIDLETALAIHTTIETVPCRLLLYRLALAGLAVSADEIRTLANVVPPLSEPTQCIARLDGLWLRRVARDRYEVSPLASSLSSEVPEEVHKALHLQVADLVFRRRTIRPNEFFRAIMSLVLAGESNAAAMHLVQGCVRWPDKSGGFEELGVRVFFPPNQSHGLSSITEIPLRAVQAVTAAIEREDPQPYMERMRAITNVTDRGTAMGAVMAGSLILSSVRAIPTSLAVLAALLIEKFHKSPQLPDKLPVSLPGFPDGAHLVLTTASVQTWDDVGAFIQMLGELSPSRREQVMLNPGFCEALQAMMWRPLFVNTRISKDAWPHLESVVAQASDLKLVIVEAYAIAGLMVILADGNKDIDGMLAKADAASVRFAHNPLAQAIIDSTSGQQLAFAGRPHQALPRLICALRDPTLIVGIERANRLADALCATWEVGESPAEYADALALMLGGTDVQTPYARAPMHAQVALVRWREGFKVAAFAHLESSAVSFLELEQSTRQAHLGGGLSAVLMHCMVVAESGSIPKFAPDGTPYKEPSPSLFQGTSPEIARLWRTRQGPTMLFWMLGRLAQSVGIHESATSWTDRAMEAALESKAPVALVMLTPRRVAEAIRASAWPDALEAAIVHGRARVCADDKNNQGARIIEDSVVFEPFEPPTDPIAQERAETYSLWLLSNTLLNGMAARVITGSSDDRSAMSQLSGHLSEVSEKSLLKPAWQAMASIMHLVAAETITDQQHKAALADSQQTGWSAARLLTHGLLALRADVRLQQAAVSQAGALQTLARDIGAFNLPLDEYALAISAFWAEALSRSAFGFSSPRAFSETLREAQSATPLARAKTILSAALAAQGAAVSSTTREWLTSP